MSAERTIAIVQARMGSSRLPGKVLMDIAGKPMLERVVARLRRAACLDGYVVATTVESIDDPVVDAMGPGEDVDGGSACQKIQDHLLGDSLRISTDTLGRNAMIGREDDYGRMPQHRFERLLNLTNP